MKSRCFFACWLIISLFLSHLPTQAQDTASILSPESGQQIPDTLLFRIQKAQSIITEVKAAGRRGYGVARIRADLAQVQANVTPIQDDIKRQDANTDAKSLANYRLILNDAQTKLSAWQTSLSKANNDLQSQLNQLLTLSSDSLLVVAGNDTTEKKLYSEQLVGLKLQLQEAGVRTTAQLDTVSRLLANVSGTSLLVNDLQTTLNEQAQQSVVDVFQQEAPFLWNAPTPTTADESKTLIRSTYQGQQKILTYFLASTWDNRFLLYLLTAGFFVWVFTNYRRARELSIDPDSDTLHSTLR